MSRQAGRWGWLFVPVVLAAAAPRITHGPMLGAVSEHSARLWVRLSEPAEVICILTEAANSAWRRQQSLRPTAKSDYTGCFTFDSLRPDTRYHYVVRVGDSEQSAAFTTPGPALDRRRVRLVYGYGYKPSQDKMPSGTSVFQTMAARRPDLVLFLGDFPYTSAGARQEIWAGHRELRSVVGFRKLTAGTPTYGIYDDHDFGPNDCDGTHKNAAAALAAFKDYWPNPAYGQPDAPGIYCSFVVGNVEFFLLDGRYAARKKQKTMLGPAQFDWLCRRLKASRRRYKVLVSGTQFGRVKNDSWGGEYYVGERQKLFAFLVAQRITGVIGISGDVHRSDVYRLPMGGGRFFYDFTPGALARSQRKPPDPKPPPLLRSYGQSGDNNLFGEIDFHPPSDARRAIVFRSFSARRGLIYEHVLSPADLGLRP